MMEGKLSNHTKSLFFRFLFLVLIPFTTVTLYDVMKNHMAYLGYLLYDRSHLSAVSRLSGALFLKAVFMILFFLIGIVLLYIYFFSYYQIIYLQAVLFCVCIISYIASFQELNVLFYSGQPARHFWQNAGLIGFLTLFLGMLLFSFDFILRRLSFLWTVIPCLVLIVFSAVILTRRYVVNRRLLPAACAALAVYGLFLTVFAWLWERKRLLLRIPVLILMIYLIISNVRFRESIYETKTLNKNLLLYNMSLYISIAGGLLVLVLTVWEYKNMLMHSRTLNRNVQGLEQAKSMLLGLIYSNVKNYLYSATTALDNLAVSEHLHPSDDADIKRIRSDLSNMETLYRQIHSYTIFSDRSFTSSPIHVNLSIFARMLEEKLSYDGLLRSGDEVDFRNVSGFADFAPDFLLQSLEYLTWQLRQISEEHLIVRGERITGDGKGAQPEGSLYRQVFSFTCGKTVKNIRAGKEKTPFPGSLRGRDQIPDFSSLDYTIIKLRSQIKPFGGHVQVQAQDFFRIQIALPLSAAPMTQKKEELLSCRGGTQEDPSRLLVLSTDSRQMEEICSILPVDKYSFVLSNHASLYMENPDSLSSFSMIIVGTLFRDVYFRDFYDCVRSHYAMTELPILMLLPDLYEENSFYIRSTINDYLIPPYSQVSLEKKIHALLAVKKTADRAIEAQLAFWQSQINPHFIFNSINAIMQLCIDKPMKAYELLDNFSEYLRGHLLSVSLNQISTIQKEIDLVSAYLKIERERFGDKIRYEMDVDCDRNFPIPALLIEPLIENAIRHSSMKERGISVNLQIYQMGHHLLIRVEDTGNGIPPQIIEQILNGTYKSRSVGLLNVCSRLKHYYRVVPAIESTVGEGTVIQFTITDQLKGGSV